MERTYAISMFAGARDNQPKAQRVTLAELTQLLTTHLVRVTKDGAAWSPASYGEGAKRRNNQAREVCAFVLDIDDGCGLEALKQVWSPYTYILHSTHSSTEAEPKFRVVFPLAAPVAATEWKACFEKLSLALSHGIADSACSDAARLYYLPSTPSEEAWKIAEAHSGRLLDESEFAPIALEEERGRPGDDYNRQTTWEQLLEPTDAVKVRTDSSCSYWTRPGKDPAQGHAAVTGLGGKKDLLYVFSSSWPPFEPKRPYDKFGAYAALHHKGDVQAAASELAKQGYGSPSTPEKEEKKTLAQVLIGLVDAEGLEVLNGTDGHQYGRVKVRNHLETFRIGSKSWKEWLQRLLYKALNKACSDQVLTEASGILAGRARFDSGEKRDVFLRVGELDGCIYIDLGCSEWRVAKVTREGWEVIDECPVVFRRSQHMLPLPTPTRGGTLRELRPFVNPAGEGDFMQMVSWLVMSLHPSGPYPVLVLSGEQGSAKSTTARILKRLSDPGKPDLRQLPTDDKDLKAAAVNSHVLTFDNLSKITSHMSDSLCKLATGGGISNRANYTDDEEAVFEGKRAVIVTAIEDVVNKPDLADRSLFPRLPALKGQVKSESVFWDEFQMASGSIFGAVLTALSTALRRLPEIPHDQPFRMADFARFILAAEPALGFEESFAEVYQQNRQSAKQEALASSPLASAVVALVSASDWDGSATELVKALAGYVSEAEARFLPSSRNVRSVMKTVLPLLRAEGIEVIFGERDRNRRPIFIKKGRENVVTVVTPSPTSSHEPAAEEPVRDNRDGVTTPSANTEAF